MSLKEIIKVVAKLDLPEETYLVGGSIRDYCLGLESRDIDLVTVGSAKKIAVKLAEITDGSFVVLDEQRSMYRVVTADLIYDLSSMVGSTLEDDLQRRDFTINAVALNLNDAANPEESWIDPLGGLNDIKVGKIRAVSATSFTADPQRILRMFRFKTQFDFIITQKTKQLAKQAVTGISGVANERIKEELLRICSYSGTAQILESLEETGVMSILLPQVDELQEIGVCKHHQEDVWTHSLVAVEKVEQLLNTEYWSTKISDDKVVLLKLAALLHDYGKIFTEEKIDGEIHFYGHQKVGVEKLRPVLKNLAFSNQEINYILTLVRYHMRPLALYRAENLTFKGKYRFFKAGAEYVADICLLAVADKMSTAELNNREQELAGKIEFLQKLMEEKEEFEKRGQKKIISGNDLMEEFGLAEGPKIGIILEKVNELQAQGEISTREEALKLAEQYIN